MPPSRTRTPTSTRIANNQSPVADNSSAGTNHRRSRPMGWATAAAASSTAIDALNAGCNIACPVNSLPGGKRNAITVKYTP